MASCGLAAAISLMVMAASVSYGRKFLAVTVTVLAVTALADWPQCGYGRMTKKAMRSYTTIRLLIQILLQSYFHCLGNSQATYSDLTPVLYSLLR